MPEIEEPKVEEPKVEEPKTDDEAHKEAAPAEEPVIAAAEQKVGRCPTNAPRTA